MQQKEKENLMTLKGVASPFIQNRNIQDEMEIRPGRNRFRV